MAEIKIVHIVQDMGIGGIERVVFNLAASADKRKYDTQIWCLTGGGPMAKEAERAGIEVSVLGMGKKITLGFLSVLSKRLREEGISVVHAHGLPACTAARAAAIWARTPAIIAHIHTTYLNLPRKQRIIDRLLALKTDAIICCSQAVRQSVLAEGVRCPDPVVVYNGAPDMGGVLHGEARRALGLEPDTKVIGCVSSLNPHKGVDYLLCAMPEILRSFPRAVLLLVGDGSQKAFLQDTASALGIEKSIIFAGAQTDVRPFLSAMDVAVQPSSKREGLALALVEAMSAGKPLVGTKLGGIPEVITDGENGLLVQPADSAALAGAVIRLLSDEKLAAALSARGREIYKTHFSLEAMSKSVSGIYERIL